MRGATPCLRQPLRRLSCRCFLPSRRDLWLRRQRPRQRWPRLILLLGSFLLLAGAFPRAAGAAPEDLPIDVAAIERTYEARRGYNVRNPLSLEQVASAVTSGDEKGLRIDLRGITRLLDGTRIDPAKIYGEVFAGPYPFEATETAYAYARFRARARIRGGRAHLRLRRLLGDDNSEDWTDAGQLCVRCRLFLEQPAADRELGVYDTFVRFRKTARGFEKLPSVIETPRLGLVRSDDPARVVIAFRSDVPQVARVVLGDGRVFASEGAPAVRHEIEISGLEPATRYQYRVELGEGNEDEAGAAAPSHTFRTAPPRGQGAVMFAYTGDSREGIGGGEYGHMGVNFRTLERLTALARVQGAELLLVGGDLVNGYTSSTADFATQLEAWKQAVAGFWQSGPVYPVMGNHDSLLRAYRSRKRGEVAFDRWPYATESAEAVFAREMLNPRNGPAPADLRRPEYTENVYSFQYGPVLCIALNNNYWAVDPTAQFGGCPEGYILPDQMDWLAGELARAERDRSVRYVILYAQEPVFPCGGHLKDAMWYNGDNGVRAQTYRDGVVVPEPAGLIEVRNRLVRLVAGNAKVAAVLGSDEHVYHRVLIGKEVPVGDVARDDANGNGRIDWPAESCSPLADLRHRTWYLTSGGAGAPYYGEEPAPWSAYWKATADPQAGYRFSSQENIMIFRADAKRIGVQVFNPNGELIDQVADLMAPK